MTAAYIFAVILIILGIAWYRHAPVSAGRPGSFFVMMGSLGIVAILLSGCGESISEYKQNEKRDATIRSNEKDLWSVEERFRLLEERVSVLERAARHQEDVK